MAELPLDRLQGEPPFNYCEVELFGPCVIGSKRKELERYGAMFACLCSRTIHIEVNHSLDTDSFLLTLRRFIGRRGNIRQVRAVNGSNFFEAVKELRKSFQDMNHNRINEYLQVHGADWITWINNPPTASHMAGDWERQIRTARGILNALIKTYGKRLDGESLHTLLVKVEAIVKSKPMTTETISDVKSGILLSPANLLIVGTVTLKLGSENNAQGELV